MLLGIISDTHDEIERTRRAIEILLEKGIGHLVHCGDVTGEEIIELCSAVPFTFVFGNHDCDNVPVLLQAANRHGARCLEWGGQFLLERKRIAVAHGHLKSDIEPLLQSGPEYLLTGHFHEHAEWIVGQTRRVCPGALRRSKTFTVATIDLQTDIVKFHELT